VVISAAGAALVMDGKVPGEEDPVPLPPLLTLKMTLFFRPFLRFDSTFSVSKGHYVRGCEYFKAVGILKSPFTFILESLSLPTFSLPFIRVEDLFG